MTTINDLKYDYYKDAPRDLSEKATQKGARCNSQKILTNFDTAVPIYILFENPIDSGRVVALQQRKFKPLGDSGISLQIFWDYDVSTATKTPYPIYNEFNRFRNNTPAFEASILNTVTAPDDGDWTITGAATIADEGIERESDRIPTITGGFLQPDSAGDITPESGYRLYEPGTGFLVKLVSDANDNTVLFGYNWLELEDNS